MKQCPSPLYSHVNLDHERNDDVHEFGSKFLTYTCTSRHIQVTYIPIFRLFINIYNIFQVIVGKTSTSMINCQLSLWGSDITCTESRYTALQKKTAVTAYLKSNQLLLFALARQYSWVCVRFNGTQWLIGQLQDQREKEFDISCCQIYRPNSGRNQKHPAPIFPSATVDNI